MAAGVASGGGVVPMEAFVQRVRARVAPQFACGRWVG